MNVLRDIQQGVAQREVKLGEASMRCPRALLEHKGRLYRILQLVIP